MAQIFYVHCPACGGKFPCHPELWQVDYDLLCPFCQTSFPQEESPLIITTTGERRAGRDAAARADGTSAAGASPARPPRGQPADSRGSADSM